MMSLTEIAKLFGQAWPWPETQFTGVSTDSRSIMPHDLFVALKGEHFNGHDFIQKAQEAGAVAAIVSEPVTTSLPLIQVTDTTQALMQLAAAWRQQFTAKVLAITGSCGKTSTRAMLAAILAECGNTLSSEKSFNNHVGVPLTLLRMRPSHEFVVVEMGTNHPGEIAPLVEMARPQVAVITNAGPSHLEGLGSVEGVAKEKANIYRQLGANDVAIINEDDAFADFWKGGIKQAAVMTFGFHSSADVRAQRYHADVQGRSQFTLVTPAGHTEIVLPLLGKHNVYNALAAAAMATAVGVSLSHIQHGLAKTEAEQRRLVEKKGLGSATIIDDSYNANPASVKAAIDVLAKRKGQRVLILGDMLELGRESDHYHREIGAAAKEAGIDYLFGYGPKCALAVAAFGKNAMHFVDQAALVDTVRPLLNSTATVLVKGSNSMGMNRVTLSLLQE